jgi:hypothetical protein
MDHTYKIVADLEIYMMMSAFVLIACAFNPLNID